MTPRGACALAAVAALAASAGDLALLWVASAGRTGLGLPAPHAWFFALAGFALAGPAGVPADGTTDLCDGSAFTGRMSR